MLPQRSMRRRELREWRCSVWASTLGFVMDLLPIFLMGTSSDVQHLRVTRAVDASTRRWTLL